MRILHIVPSLDVNAGMLSVVMNYYRNIDREKVQFDFLYLFESDNSYYSEICDLGGRAYCIGAPKINSEYLRRIDSFFSEHEGEFTAIHCHPIWAPAFFAGAAKKHGISRVIAHSHSVKYSEKPVSAIRNRMFMPMVRHEATDYFACSSAAAKLFRLHDESAVHVLPNAIDSSKFVFNEDSRAEIRNEFSISEDEILVGHVGRFSIEKNHEFILRLFKLLLEEKPNSKLMLVGDGPLYSQIVKIASELGLESNIIFTGMRKDVEKIMSALDVFVLPSRFEGVPVVAIEAQASGLPCIISDTVTKEIDILGCGYVSITEGEKPWTEAIEKCVLRKDDRASANLLIAESKYNVKAEAACLENYYLSLND